MAFGVCLLFGNLFKKMRPVATIQLQGTSKRKKNGQILDTPYGGMLIFISVTGKFE